MVNANTGAVVVQSTNTIGPDVTVTRQHPPSAILQTFCRFTVLDGVNSDVRAAIAVFSPNSMTSQSDNAALAAQ
jgi:hypothetical protein